MSRYTLDLEKYASIARTAAAEGCVLLKNENKTLPIQKGEKVAVFGRIAFDYYKSGLGSGGLVNTRYVVGILDALKERENNGELLLDTELLKTYEDWIAQNPFDHGSGWGMVPWSQKEMPIELSAVEAAKEADIAVVIIGRTAGEDQDTKLEPGSYLLTEEEEALLEKVTKVFTRVAVVLNVGNIIDMGWVTVYNPSAVLYAWQGGQEGGNGVVDVLTGTVNPCGKLTDTIAYNISDYPSTDNFGDLERNYYKEDIYVGYRYFETFSKESVMYPFGFGLSYTNFSLSSTISENMNGGLTFNVIVKNIGDLAGKEVVQIYMEAPQGLLGKPHRTLVGYGKTEVLQPKEQVEIELFVPFESLASYDDAGVTGNKSCFVMEKGEYRFYIGADVRMTSVDSSTFTGVHILEEDRVIERLSEAYAPVLEFERMRPELINGNYQKKSEWVPQRTQSPEERRLSERKEGVPYEGDLGYTLQDVYEKKVTMDRFLAQLTDEDMMHMFRGEGMCSPKVTPGTAAAFGGITPALEKFKIPAACCADGPSGIRMDCGTKAFSLPNGTALGCTFNDRLVEDLFEMLGKELRKNKIDTLLGPGMNIHRNPLNGRNFEYISEDPLVTGKISAAQVKGMGHSGVTGTIKHFTANNQEAGRRSSDSVVSERALREIYLKGFEIAIKEGKAGAVMTTYGAVNGIWTAGSYDLCTRILRTEWGFDGVVMTDWWAEANIEGEKSTRSNKASMILAQNDVYMCVSDSVSNPENDNVEEAIASGIITRYDLQRNTANILNFIMRSPAMLRTMNLISKEELDAMEEQDEDGFAADDIVFYEPQDEAQEVVVIDGSHLDTSIGNSHTYGVTLPKLGKYQLEIKMKSELGVLAQLPVTIFLDNHYRFTISIQGTEGKWITEIRDFGFVFGPNHYLKLYFGSNGMDIDTITVRFTEAVASPFEH